MTRNAGSADTGGAAHAEPLAAHVAECRDCGEAKPPIDAIATLLDTGGGGIDATALSAATLERLRPELARIGARAGWRRTVAALLWGLLPLPAVVAYDAYFLRGVYAAVSALVSAPVAAYLVLNQAALLVLLFALTYAAIPLFLMRAGPEQVPASG